MPCPFPTGSRRLRYIWKLCASFVALLREDARLTPEGEIGAIDWDPICGCQDDTGMSVKISSIHSVGPSAAVALIEVRFFGIKPSAADRLELDLVAANGQ